MSREAAFSALFAAVLAAYPVGRRIAAAQAVERSAGGAAPGAVQLESGAETYQWPTPAAPKRTLEAKLFLYFDARDPATPGASAVNAALDALDAALAPAGADIALGRQTLGGAVDDCKITGVPLRDPGDLDGDAIAVVAVRVVLP